MFYGCDEIGNRGKFRPYREIVEGSSPSDHIKLCLLHNNNYYYYTNNIYIYIYYYLYIFLASIG